MRGTSIRLERIFNRDTGNAVIIPMDHGVTVGPIRGIKSVKSIADAVADLGKPEEIGQVFSGFQKYLYQQQAVLS